MAAVNSVQTSRLPLPSFSPRAVLMYSAAVGGEGAVALQLREATQGDLDAARLHEDRLAIACHEPELLADLLQAAAEIGGEGDGLSALFGASSPDLTTASDASDSLPFPEHGRDLVRRSSSSSLVSAGVTAAVSVSVAGIEARPHVTKKVRPKPSSPNRQGPQQCQICNKIFGNASALAKHKLTHSDERKYVCTMCSKAFKRQDHLNGHMLTHRNKKPYECKANGCGKSYCDARSLRRHTENHHQSSSADGSDSKRNGGSNTGVERLQLESSIQRGISPASPIVKPTHSEICNAPEKKTTNAAKSKASTLSLSRTSSGSTSGNSSSSDNSPPATPPAPLTPPSRPKPHKVSTTKTKNFTINVPSLNKNKISSTGPKCPNTTTTNNGGSTIPGPGRPNETKPVECNLCHRKFKNIPALNGHMRLHGGYFKKDSDSKKSDKKEASGPPLQTASVSVRALIEEKIISRRGATATTTTTTQISTESTSRTNFVAPAPLPISSSRVSTSPASPAPAIAATSTQFVSPRAPPVVTVTSVSNAAFATRDSTLIELLKKGNTKVVKRSSSDPGQFSPQPEVFRPELFGVSFHSDDGYFSPALNDDAAFQFATAPENLEELASLEDYATVAASIRDRSPITYPSNRRLAAVLNSPLPESLADFGACHGGSPVHSPSMGYVANSPGLSYSTGDSPGLAYTDASPGGAYSVQTAPSPGLGYPTPPGSHDAQSPATIPRASSPLTAAFFTATMSSQEEVEEALEEVLPEECGSLDAFSLDSSPSSRRIIMLNSEDPLLSSSPRDFSHQKQFRRMRNESSGPSTLQGHQWHIPTDNNALQVCVEGKDMSAVFLSPNSIPPSPQRRKRRGSPAGPYRTRMRRPSNQYTPQPILPPDRDGPGLFIEISAYQVPDLDSEMEEPLPPRINIGVDHQAEIPEPCGDRDDMHRVPEQLLWDPGINDILDEKEVRLFTELAMCAAMPVGGHSREHALRILGECAGDVRAATLKLMEYSHESGNERWTPDEVETYLSSLRHYDKDFFRMAQLIRTKTSKQCVQFYYFWKKLTKDYKTLYLRSWSAEPAPQQEAAGPEAVPGPSSGTSSPSPFEGEEFPCKICGKVFNKVKSRSAHMKSHRPLDAEPKRPKHEKPYEKV